jgi:hypothetical protein
MWTISHVIYGLLFVVVLGLALWDFGYFYRGRHRGEYVDPIQKRVHDVWGITPNEARAILGLNPCPDDGVTCAGLLLPTGEALQLLRDDPEEYFRPVPPTSNPGAFKFTVDDRARLHDLFWEDHGRWGDVSFDRADNAPVRGVVAGGDSGSEDP